MASKRKKSAKQLLTIIWLMTAATALIVMVVYFERIREMYNAIGRIEAGEDIDRPGSDKNIPENGTGTDTLVNDDAEDFEPEKQQEVILPDSDTDSATDYAEGGTDAETGSDEPDEADTQEPEEEDPVISTDNETGADSAATEKIDTSEHPYYYDPNLDPNKPIVALSFDDGPSPYTERILATLKEYGAKATFFMVGYQIDYYREQVKAVYEAGCQIGNHTIDHSHLNKGTKEEIAKKVYDNEDLLNEIVPVGKIVVRPPYGDYNDTTKEAVQRPMFNWSVDSLDWKTRNAQSVYEQIKSDVKDGYIILCHDLYESTAEAVELFVPWLVNEGYQVTCISNMYEARGEETHDGHIYRYTDPAPTQ